MAFWKSDSSKKLACPDPPKLGALGGVATTGSSSLFPPPPPDLTAAGMTSALNAAVDNMDADTLADVRVRTIANGMLLHIRAGNRYEPDTIYYMKDLSEMEGFITAHTAAKRIKGE